MENAVMDAVRRAADDLFQWAERNLPDLVNDIRCAIGDNPGGSVDEILGAARDYARRGREDFFEDRTQFLGEQARENLLGASVYMEGLTEGQLLYRWNQAVDSMYSTGGLLRTKGHPRHHIIPKSDTRINVRNLVGNNMIWHPLNGVILDPGFHSRLHTRSYIDTINRVTVRAFDTGGEAAVFEMLGEIAAILDNYNYRYTLAAINDPTGETTTSIVREAIEEIDRLFD